MTRSITPAMAPDDAVPGCVGRAGVGMGRSDFDFAFVQRLTEVAECLAAELVANLREELALLLLDVVADVLDQHRHLGVEALVAAGSMPSSSDSTHLTMWCSSRLSSAMSSVSGTVARATG